MSVDHYHQPSDRSFAKALREAAPAEFKAYRNFADIACGRTDGAIPQKYRELIAIAVGLTTQCVYCLETHTNKARELGVTAEEIAEVVYITAALRAGAAAAHGLMMMKMYQHSSSEPITYHEPSDRSFGLTLREKAPAEFAAYRNFSDTACGRTDGSIPLKWREIIAVAVALTTQCVYCLETHTTKAKKLGVSEAELAETIMITAALRAGGGAAHGLMCMKLFTNANAA